LMCRPWAPQPAHTGRLRESATTTVIPSSLNAISLTHASASPSIRLYAVVIGTSSLLRQPLNFKPSSSLPNPHSDHPDSKARHPCRWTPPAKQSGGQPRSRQTARFTPNDEEPDCSSADSSSGFGRGNGHCLAMRSEQPGRIRG
jgi:hypothetical protein